MKKVIAILLVSFYSLGSLLLPRGNFAYIEQIPQLYHDFSVANNENDFFDFLEEQFFEFEFFEDADETDEPYEKENKPVPFYALSSQLIVAMPILQTAGFIIHHIEKTKATFIYTLVDYWVYPPSIFHPPKV